MVFWMYGDENGVWRKVTDDRIEEFYQEWLVNREETGIVYHCFGDGRTTGVHFGDMRVFSFTKQQNPVNYNRFDLMRIEKATMNPNNVFYQNN